jgi:hypothetical protein
VRDHEEEPESPTAESIKDLILRAFAETPYPGDDALVPEPAVVTALRVMVGRHIGGVATEFVQGY